MLAKKIVLLTDFGHDSHYVGIMKGVISKIAPDCQIIDLCHSIQPQNIRQAAFILRDAINYFPSDTVFCCVVDPGVGSNRNPIVVETEHFSFVAPDNGILTYCFKEFKKYEIMIPDDKYFLNNMSHTFHGRDVFAPLSAFIAKGDEIKGRLIEKSAIVHLPYLKQIILDGSIEGEMIFPDRFGNIITSIHKDSILKASESKNIYEENIEIHINSITINGISRTYSDVKIGEYLAYIGSSNHLEIGIRNGDALSEIREIDNIKVIIK